MNAFQFFFVCFFFLSYWNFFFILLASYKISMYLLKDFQKKQLQIYISFFLQRQHTCHFSAKLQNCVTNRNKRACYQWTNRVPQRTKTTDTCTCLHGRLHRCPNTTTLITLSRAALVTGEENFDIVELRELQKWDQTFTGRFTQGRSDMLIIQARQPRGIELDL